MKKLKQSLKNRLLKYLLNTVTVDEIHTYNKSGKHFLAGNELTPQELAGIASEIRFYRESRLYKVLSSTVINKAKKAIFEKSLNFDDIVSGKMLLYADSLHTNIMNSLYLAYEKQVRDK